jgi:hypothetical protein
MVQYPAMDYLNQLNPQQRRMASARTPIVLICQAMCWMNA